MAPSSSRFPLVGSIDEGTSSARFLIFSARTSRRLAGHQEVLNQLYPREGWVEQDPMEILAVVKKCLQGASSDLLRKGFHPSAVAAVGITNQRETTIVWDKTTGKPLHNAIVWLDTRTATTVDQLLEKIPQKDINYLKEICGLPLSPYFSALKIRWLIDNVPEVKKAIDEKRCLFGNVDAWLIWNLTGGVNGGRHITDVTNASRTMLMSLKTLNWHPELYNFFNIPVEILPEIKSSSEIYGTILDGDFKDVPISGCLGDQQASLFGHLCLKKGQAKSTYGTGCFLLYNTGNQIVHSRHGLLTTVGYKLGKNQPAVYALEGSVAVAGAAFGWLKDNFGIISSTKEIEELAGQVHSSGDVYFVPAFSGLYAPYWQSDARGVICGITEKTQRSHLVRAGLEAICFQTKDILEAMNKDCGYKLTELQVDGGMVTNNILVQLQADLCGIPTIRPHMAEITALGAAIVAGVAEGIDVWDLSDIGENPHDKFIPKISETARIERYSRWKMAVERSFGWITEQTTQ